MCTETFLAYLSVAETIELCIFAILLGVVLHIVDRKW